MIKKSRVVGACRYCGQEFVSAGGLRYHERQACPQRPDQDVQSVADEQEAPRWRKVTYANGATGWIRA